MTNAAAPGAAGPRVGVFGGAFDPPHIAHVALARAAVEQLQLDELRIFPTGQAWHKAQTLSAPEHRLAMARIAFADVPRAVIDDRELRRPGPTYTIDTLRELMAERPQAQLFLASGRVVHEAGGGEALEVAFAAAAAVAYARALVRAGMTTAPGRTLQPRAARLRR